MHSSLFKQLLTPVRQLVILLPCYLLCSSSPATAADREMKRIVVYEQTGHFAGWPAGHGVWNWGDEILVGFSIGHFNGDVPGHAIDRTKPEHHVLARSRDGGETWKLEYPQRENMLVNLHGMRKGITSPELTEPQPRRISEPINFSHPDFCMTLRLTQINSGTSRMYYSYDRGHRWSGPFQVPDFGQPGVMARTDYLARDSAACDVFLTVAKSNRREGRIIATRMTNGGLEWNFRSFVGDEPKGFAIMPSTVRTGPRTLFMATRRRSEDGRRRWIEGWHSADDAKSWSRVGDLVPDAGKGNPPSLLRLHDGRLCLTYGVRKPPFQISARLSQDDGRNWTQPLVLRSGGTGSDIGYTRSVQRIDGKLVTIYYYQPEHTLCPRIEAVIW